jgi:LysR family transcriptional regulator, hydrogen peroxide-inducible genes activator
MATIDGVFDPRATTLPVLRYLIAVADLGSFSKAAAACSVAQPTLSAQVAQWESRMRVTVFERTRGAVRLTATGERVIAEARSALDSLRRLEDAAVSAKPPFFGPVRLGMIPTVGPFVIPLICPPLERAFPELSLPIAEQQTDQLLDQLERNRLDLLLIALLPGMERGRAILPLYEEPFSLALPRGHRLAKRERVPIAELEQERLLLLDDGHCLRDQVLELCRIRDASAHTGADYRATSLETLRQMVAQGIGCTILPALAIADEPDERIVLKALTSKEASRTIGLVWRANDARAEAYRMLGGVIRTSLPRGRVHPL